MLRVLSTILVLAILICPRQAQATPSLITNGTFNQTGCCGGGGVGGGPFGSGAPGLDHWCKDLGGACVSTTACLGGEHPSVGNWVVLDHDGLCTGLVQGVHFCAGTTYTLSFCVEAPCRPVSCCYNVAVQECVCALELKGVTGNPGPQDTDLCPACRCSDFNAAFVNHGNPTCGLSHVCYSFVPSNTTCGFIRILGNDELSTDGPLGVGNIQLTAAAAVPEVDGRSAAAPAALMLAVLAIIAESRRSKLIR